MDMIAKGLKEMLSDIKGITDYEQLQESYQRFLQKYQIPYNMNNPRFPIKLSFDRVFRLQISGYYTDEMKSIVDQMNKVINYRYKVGL